MIKVETGINTLEIRFRYDVLPYKGNTYDPRRVVQCSVSVGDFTKFPGVAICRPPDIFSKAKGRKIALKKAINGFNRPTRTLIWKAYFDYLNHSKQQSVTKGATQ